MRKDIIIAAAVLAVLAGLLTIGYAQVGTEDLFELRRSLIEKIESAVTRGDADTLKSMSRAEDQERRRQRYIAALDAVPLDAPSGEFKAALRSEVEKDWFEFLDSVGIAAVPLDSPELEAVLRSEIEKRWSEFMRTNPPYQWPKPNELVGVSSAFSGLTNLLSDLLSVLPCYSIMYEDCYGEPNDYEGSGYRPCMNRADGAGPAKEARQGGCEWQLDVCRGNLSERAGMCIDNTYKAWQHCPFCG